ncbi:uncharacterized protein LOC142523790 [Primulina tabacum]|uniref:uncharacterized protein LOC142523790 n=1 Tax=Primulina tabacum TaxID=48773 RepID=UPI003F5A726F
MSLRQGYLSVAEFIRRFDQGCNFVPLIARDAAKKLRYFIDGLRPSIRRDVMLMRPATYDAATVCPFQAEHALRDIDVEMQRKATQESGSTEAHFKKPGQQRPPRAPGAPKLEEKQPCKQCSRFQFGKCTWGIFKSFICKDEGHKAANCPRNNGLTISRAYVMHAEEAEAEPDSTMIIGIATYSLLDSGATHSFIFETLSSDLVIVPEAMDLGFRVSIHSGDQMFTSRIVRNMELRLQKNVVQADMIVLLVPEFDIILGIDWLSSNEASIDFRRRSVSVRPPSEKSFIFEAARNKQMTHIISCICARKLMKRGYQSFLDSIVTLSEPVSQRLEDVEVIRDFSSVFLEDVSGIPPDREVNFSIELMLRTVPISKALYRLAPTEMKKLKDHIQDLLDKGAKGPTVREADVPKAAFRTRYGHYEFMRGAQSALDDNTTDFEGQTVVCQVSKCEFWLDRVAFLGHIISRDGVEVDPSKVEAVRDLPVPKSVTEILSFLELAGYYRKFIQGFSSIAVPMTTLTKKNAKFNWGSDCQESSEKLKQALTSAPVLSMPSGQGQYVLYIDALQLGLGTVLMHHDKVMAYASRLLKVHEKNYPTHTLELAAKELNMRRRRWLELVKDYDCDIIFHPCNDALSRKIAVIAQLSVQRPLQTEIQRFKLAIYARGDAPNL